MRKRAVGAERIGAGGIYVEHIDQAGGGARQRAQALGELSNDGTMEWIVEIHKQRRTRPAEFQSVLLHHADGRSVSSDAIPLLDVALRDLRQAWMKLHAYYLAKRQLRSEQQHPSLAGPHVDEGIRFDPPGQRGQCAAPAL